MCAKKISISFFLLTAVFFTGFAQLEADNWAFNSKGYVNFHHASFPDTVLYRSFQRLELNYGTVSYSNRDGDLLFYGGGGLLFDRNFQLFPSLSTSASGPLYNTFGLSGLSQTMLAIPFPDHDSLYIIFHIRADMNNGYNPELYYSLLDMRLRNGLGEIVPGQRNIRLFDGSNVAYKLTAVLHCNKKDIWVIGHLLNSDQYFSLLVTDNGISSSPVYFPGGFLPPVQVSTYALTTGCIKVSADGSRLASAVQARDSVEIFDFNAQSGLGSGQKTISAHPSYSDTLYMSGHSNIYGPFGVDFSPSGSRLYVTSNYDLKVSNNYGYGAFVYQFDATLSDAQSIQNSQFRVDSAVGFVGGAIQIANNGKLYVNLGDDLSEVANSEAVGAGCGYVRNLIKSGQQFSNGNLPAFLQSYFRYPVVATGNCQFQNISFSIQNTAGISSVQWNFGDPASGIDNLSSSLAPVHIFSTEGTYKVTAVLLHSNGCGADTVIKMVHAGPFKVYLGRDTVMCQGDTLRLRSNVPGGLNTWSDLTHDTVLKVFNSGLYWVRVNMGDCIAVDTIRVDVRPLPAFSLGRDTTVCNGEPLLLSANINPIGATYLWSDGQTGPQIAVQAEGIYWLAVSNADHCTFRDTVNVYYRTLPGFSLGNDSTLCQADLRLQVTVNDASSYLWSTGSTASAIVVNNSGLYWAEITKDNCTYRDSVAISFKPYPVINLGRDTTLCLSSTLLLDAGNLGATYSWQDASTQQTYRVNRSGAYWVAVDRDNCISKDTIVVGDQAKPRFTLGADQSICDGEKITLHPGPPGADETYAWQDGSTAAGLTVNAPGLYILNITNKCGVSSDSVLVSSGACGFFMPTAFTPNGDGLNDILKPIYRHPTGEFSINIFNRWGEKVFESHDLANGWDGKYRGILQGEGAFAWIVRIKPKGNAKEELFKGTSLLVRN